MKIFPRRQKYNNKKIKIDGISFDSLKEGRRYEELKLLVESGEIEDLVCHPKFPIVINGKKVCSVLLDFSYFLVRQQETIFEDVKSKATATSISKLKKKMCEASHSIEIIWVY
jgi:Protein of unknown function (DUF1064)